MTDAVATEPTAAPDPYRPPPPVPWNAGEIVFLFFFLFLVFFVYFWPSVAFESLRSTGFFAWYYPDQPSNGQARQQLWTTPLAFPFQVATVLGLAFLFLGVRPAALGLTRQRLVRNVALGFGCAALLTPLVVGLHQLLVALYKQGLGVAEQKHPLARLGETNLTGLEWGLLLFTAIVAAPVVEELLFRGVFQPAAGKSRWGGLVGIGLAAVLIALIRQDQFSAAVRQLRDADWTAAMPTVLDALAPVAFLLATVLVFFLTASRSRDYTGPAILGTSVLFAMVHAGVWPSPIALFVLSLGLGWLKERTRSLVGPIVLHSLFNAVNCVMLMQASG